MVRFQENALVVEIPCQAGEAVDFYELFQEALCGVNWLASAYASEDILYVGRELGFFGSHLGPALAKLDPVAKKAIMGQLPAKSTLSLSYEEWKERHFAGFPDVWTMRFWLAYQKQHNGPYAQVQPTPSTASNLENLSYSAIQEAFPELPEVTLGGLLVNLNKALSGDKYFSLAELSALYPELNPERLEELLMILNQVQEQEDQRQSAGDELRDAQIEAIIHKLDQLSREQLQQVTTYLTNL